MWCSRCCSAGCWDSRTPHSIWHFAPTGPLAQVKTWREQGVPADYISYNGVLLTPGVNADQIRYWEAALRKVALSKEWIALVEKSGNKPIFRGYVDSHRYLADEWIAAHELAASLGLKAAK